MDVFSWREMRSRSFNEREQNPLFPIRALIRQPLHRHQDAEVDRQGVGQGHRGAPLLRGQGSERRRTGPAA